MKVVHVLWRGYIGGAERAVFQLCCAQKRFSEFKPVMAYCQATGYYADLLRGEGIEVLDLGLRRGSDYVKLPHARRILNKFPIHHFHSTELVPMFASSALAGPTRIYTHRGGADRYPPLKAALYRLAGGVMRFRFHAFSGNTRRGCESGSQVLGLRAADWQVTYNGLDFPLLTPKIEAAPLTTKLGIPTGTPVIGTSANLRAWKRIDLLLTACAKLVELPFSILIVGDGPDRARLEQFTDTLGLRKRVIFAGKQEHMADYLQLMDIFVLPSNSEESFGNSVVEAMAMGIPGLVFKDGGGLPEHVTDNHTGFVVGSVNELSQRLRDLLSDPALRKRLGEAGRTSIREKYTMKAMVSRYDALYHKALGQSGTAEPKGISL